MCNNIWLLMQCFDGRKIQERWNKMDLGISLNVEGSYLVRWRNPFFGVPALYSSFNVCSAKARTLSSSLLAICKYKVKIGQ